MAVILNWQFSNSYQGYIWCISSEIAPWWIPQDLPDDKSTMVEAMTWCCQTTRHYLNQCWPRANMVSSGLIELNAILCFCFLPYMAMQHTRWILILSTQKCYDFYKLKFFASISSLYNFFSKHDGLKTAALKFSCNDWNIFSLQCAYLKSITSGIFFTFDNVVTK